MIKVIHISFSLKSKTFLIKSNRVVSSPKRKLRKIAGLNIFTTEAKAVLSLPSKDLKIKN